MAGLRLRRHEGHPPLKYADRCNKSREENKHTEDEDDSKQVPTVMREYS